MNLSSLIGDGVRDRLTIDTPEGVPLELTLAGVGSRFTSALIDYVFQTIILVALLLVLRFGVGIDRARADRRGVLGGGLLRRLLGLRRRLRVLNSGRTPGKAMNGLRSYASPGRR
jgi:uncharacterized RDD family membrane protein YckC